MWLRKSSSDKEWRARFLRATQILNGLLHDWATRIIQIANICGLVGWLFAIGQGDVFWIMINFKILAAEDIVPGTAVIVAVMIDFAIGDRSITKVLKPTWDVLNAGSISLSRGIIGHKPIFCGVKPRHQTGARRPTDWHLTVCFLKDNAALCQAVDVR